MSDDKDQEWAEFRATVRDEKLGAHTEALVALCVPSLRVRPAAQSTLRSRLGGLPDLPAGFVWPIGDPVVPGARGTLGAAHPMDFVAQLDLAEVHATGLAGVDVLPPAGTLAFFHGYRTGPDEHHAGSAGAVFYFAPELALARADAPSALTPLPRVHVMFEVATEALPPVESPFYAALLGDVAAADRVAGLAACYAQEGVRDAGDRPVHRVLGYADPLQADPYVSTEGNSSVAPPSTWNTLDVLRRATRWRLLLQLDSDPERGVLYGDGGVLAFMIRDDDLAARRFERAWVELQGH